jgi:superfamily II DNA or RNA helicase
MMLDQAGVRWMHPDEVRARIARTLLIGDDDTEASSTLGELHLRAHQIRGIDRVSRILEERGGALLADETGLGKTYVALGVAARYRRVLLCIPAALRPMWREALMASRVSATVATYAALSRGSAPRGPFDLVIADEAHHARTPSTARYRRLAQLCQGARILLITATPIHNGRQDLAALLTLFLGECARAMDDAALSEFIVRRDRESLQLSSRLPELAEPRWLPLRANDELLEQIAALPPPLPPLDGGDGGTLVTWSLIRQWASSQRALVGALARRLSRGVALEAALESGRFPTRRELRAWCAGDGAVQLGFPELLVAASTEAAPLLATVRAHLEAVRALLRRARAALDPDVQRAALVRALRLEHPSEKIIAFAAFEETVLGLFQLLAPDGGVAALTARGGLVAGGRLARRDLLRRFAPRASGATPPSVAEQIDLLLTTDLLSEGVNLQDAAVVVHLDLPWTPARLEQRVGRSRRLGASHWRTSVYVMRPPATAEALLEVERRLRQKLQAAGRALGVAGTILPSMMIEDVSTSPTRHRECIARILEDWLSPESGHDTDSGRGADPVESSDTQPLGDDDVRVIAAAVAAPRRGVLALFWQGERAVLCGALDDRVLTGAPERVSEVLCLASGPGISPNPEQLPRALAAAARCGDRLAANELSLPVASQARRGALRRIARIASGAPRSQRSVLAPLADEARRAATASYGIGGERVLGELVASSLGDEAWLRAVAAFATAQGVAASADAKRDSAPRLVAVVLLTPRTNA